MKGVEGGGRFSKGGRLLYLRSGCPRAFIKVNGVCSLHEALEFHETLEKGIVRYTQRITGNEGVQQKW